MLEARNLVCEYKDGSRRLRVLDGVSLSLQPGKSLCIVGPSGSGKSTLLYVLAGLRVPTSGSVSYRGRPLETMSNAERVRLRARDFGFVFQQHFLVKHLTVMENIFVSARSRSRETLAYARYLVERLGLKGLEHRFPASLSGGQRQRVALARALINRPAILFADEPTASLDSDSSASLMQLLAELRGETALIMVTHDTRLLDQFDRTMELVEGKLRQVSRRVS
ncbi:MAG: ABC transporter ATP-binding protein [Symbiobacterium sp.]|uniref:ABC transporter ATP-binding protein n=1 Tax=Symbiobacterium sp. TaxID=1971213 RepID=UPI003464E256